MTLPVANVDITTDTFGTWVVKTNTLAYYMSNHVVTIDQTASGNSSTGNGFVVGTFGANTLVATTLRGGTVSLANTLTISSNVGISNTLTVSNNTTLQANLSVTLGASFANTLTVTGVGTFSNNLNVTGNAAVTGAFSANGAANLNSILGVVGAVTLSNTITVTGLTTLNGGVNSTTANASVALNVGANATVNTTSVRVGNTLSNVVITSGSVFVGNSTVNVSVNSTSFSGTSNNATNLNGQSASFYTNATNLTAGTLDTARLPATANVATAINVGANVNLVTDRITVARGTNSIYIVANTTNTEIKTGNTVITPINVKADTATFGNVVVLGNFSVAATLTANGNLIPAANDTFTIGNSTFVFANSYIMDAYGNTVAATDSITVGTSSAVNTISILPTGISIGNTTVSATINSTAFTGSANNSTNFNGQAAAFYANATNLTSGTLNTARLPSVANVASEINVGANATVNTTTIRVGNSTVNTVITQSAIDTDGTLAVLGAATLSNTVAVTGSATFANTVGVTGLSTLAAVNSTTANASVAINVGANVNLTTSNIKVGNTTANVTVTNNSILVNGATVNATNFTGNANTATTLALSRNFQITGDVVAANVGFTGAGDVSLSATLANTTVTPGTYTKVTVDSKGRVNTGSYIASGDVTSALGFTPANKAGDVFSGNTTFSANVIIGTNGDLILQGNSSINANGSIGTAGQVLHSNGTSVYWDTDNQGVTSVVTGNGLTGGTITTTGTIDVLANNGITANATGLYVRANTGLTTNSTGVYVNANTGLVANATGVHVNSTYISTLTANSANTLTTGRNFSLTGDVTASAVSFNGSAAVALSTTLSNSGVVAGQYSKVTVDAKGRVTNGAYIASGDVTSALGYTPINKAGDTGIGSLQLSAGAVVRAAEFQLIESAYDTGFYSGGDGILAFKTNGDYRGQINVNGLTLYNVGSGASLDLNTSGYMSFNNAAAPDGFTFCAFNRSGSNIGSISQTASGTQVAFNTSSDYRLKQDISYVENVSDQLLAIAVRKFRWKSAPEYGFQLGFLAHELQLIVPEAVTGEKDAKNEDGTDKIQQVDYSKIVPLLTASLQEALREIENLKQRINILENK